ncbi:MAG: hypothetical protein P8L39_09265, partial [Halioglobus sp.]|nr:hypothetical protein [Halioglobus sp.]
MKPRNLLQDLLTRGDIVSIENGRLSLLPASGKPVGSDWLSQHTDQLFEEALTRSSVTGLKYESYNTGRYGEHRAGGLTMQFYNMVTSENLHAIFNVNLDRARNSKHGKAGTPLPERQFRVGKKAHIYKFWLTTGLEIPPRLSSFHDYMGNLRQLLFTGGYKSGGRLECDTLCPLNITHRQLLHAFNCTDLPYNPQTPPRQQPDNIQTRFPDKKLLEAQQPQPFPAISTTCEFSYGTSKQGSTGTRGKV